MTTDFGTGLRITDGDLDFDCGAPALVTGLPALVQDLVLRVLTPLGSDRYNTGYGFDAATVFGATGNAREIAELVRLNLIRAIGTDRRIREIHRVTLDSTDHRTWAATVELTTADGADATVPITLGS
ncbi:hypothetical protein [Nocardia thraciensis]